MTEKVTSQPPREGEAHPRRGPKPVKTPARQALIKELYKAGLKDWQIAERLGVSLSYTRRLRRAAGIKRCAAQKRTPEEIETMRQLLGPMTLAQVGEIYGLTDERIRQLVGLPKGEIVARRREFRLAHPPN